MSLQDRYEYVALANTAVMNSSAVQNLQNEPLQRRHLFHPFNIDTLLRKKPMDDGLNSTTATLSRIHKTRYLGFLAQSIINHIKNTT